MKSMHGVFSRHVDADADGDVMDDKAEESAAAMDSDSDDSFSD